MDRRLRTRRTLSPWELLSGGVTLARVAAVEVLHRRGGGRAPENARHAGPMWRCDAGRPSGHDAVTDLSDNCGAVGCIDAAEPLVQTHHDVRHRHSEDARRAGSLRSFCGQCIWRAPPRAAAPLIPLGAWIERRRRAAGRKPSEVHWPRIDLNDPDTAAPPSSIFAADDGQHRHRVAGGLPRRRVHGLGAVLRAGVPHGDEAGVHGAPGRPARARRLRAVPHRPGRVVVREVEAVRHAPGAGGDVPHLLAADSVAGAEPAAGARHLRAVSLAGEVPRRQGRGASPSTPTTRRTPSR